ncbi:MAG TPA: glycine--tRNA ligase subunit beta [Bacillota bacterium]|jgi:glycyl-tRNA synthetase beta chain|nr:glycine--tRNA ligase subunit beta [Bacillota bacterium]HOB86342.1 glycine--tRNA ligase subunit beta [Bacillota bacterium]HOP69466.1 glycine--tRNA ligase subunit beta [Bacillota bacterium]HPT34428.1 glycine--tRNA ligase subunit beta [Bacillota bacterium]HQD06434.1 glycine--tRNA ligase subunit beta [Bacillota bacterium]
MSANKDLLLEIGCEEIPSRFISPAIRQLKEGARRLLEEAHLQWGSLQAWGTPRRLVLLVSGLAAAQADQVQRIKGPPRDRAFDSQGRPTAALLGFARSHNVAPESLEEETIKGARYMVLVKKVRGLPTEEVLPELLAELLRQLHFPKPMYWWKKEVRFARPIRWLLALYGDRVVPLTYAGITAGRETWGHRFLNPGPWPVENPAHYFARLVESGVVLDQERRRQLIRQQVEEAARSCGGRALVEEALLDEVSCLVEYPVAVTGSMAPEFLDLPREVLITTMQVHQRYFPVEDSAGGELLPYFVGISNNRYHENIKRGYEKVLQARLSDARFFYDEDRKKPLESYVEQLKTVLFQESLGTLEEKRGRLVALVEKMAAALGLNPGEAKAAVRAAHLCKADLVTHMVKEFPELQGVMGREYARHSGEEEGVAQGIYEHYLPRWSGDRLPETTPGRLVSLADRLDTLAGCFAVGLIPTGSQDPYALRRLAYGAVAILLEGELRLHPEQLVRWALEGLKGAVSLSPEEEERVAREVFSFLQQRLRFIFQEKRLSSGVTEAVLGSSYETVGELYRRAVKLQELTGTLLLEEIITAYNRVANLSRKAPGGPVEEGVFEAEAEALLFRSVAEAEEKLRESKEAGDYDSCLRLLQGLKQPVDLFFDQVLVMAEDLRLRENRLNLLYKARKLFEQIADFSKIPPTKET